MAKRLELTWKAWLAIALVASLSIGGLFLFFHPGSPVARGLGTVPEPEPFLVQSNASVNTWLNLSAPANSFDDYVIVYYEQPTSGPGLLCKRSTLSEADLAAFIDIDSMYTTTGQAKIVYVRTDTSASMAWLGMVFKDTDGTWRVANVAHRSITLFFDQCLPAVVQRLGYTLPTG